MKVYGYCRVSTAEQADEGSSLALQRQQITGYAMMKGWAVADFFVEAGVSGSVALAERPEGQRLLSSLRAGDVVITAKLDRAFRSAVDALGTLEQLKEDRIARHMIDLGGDVTGNGISKMFFTILAAVAEGERDRIRERIRDAKRHSRPKASSPAASGRSAPTSWRMVIPSGSSRTWPSRPSSPACGECVATAQPTARSAPWSAMDRRPCSASWSAWAACHQHPECSPRFNYLKSTNVEVVFKRRGRALLFLRRRPRR